VRQVLSGIVLISLLAGCASGGAWVSPAGFTDDQVRRDLYECQRDSSAANHSAWIGAAGQIQAQTRANDLYRQCMRSKAYRWDSEAVATIH